MNEITITIPAVDQAAIEAITTQAQITEQSEVAALAKMRETYGTLAAHGGWIKTARRVVALSQTDKEVYAQYRVDQQGRRERGLHIINDVEEKSETEFTGSYMGTHLYLTPAGWLQLEVSGRWSQWQGSGDNWDSGVDAYEDGEACPTSQCGVIIADQQALAAYGLTRIAQGLATELAELNTKLPERFGRLRQRAEVAAELLAKISG